MKIAKKKFTDDDGTTCLKALRKLIALIWFDWNQREDKREREESSQGLDLLEIGAFLTCTAFSYFCLR